MNRRRLGWGMVLLAAILLLSQVIPALRPRPGSRPTAGPGPARYGLIHAHPEVYASPPSATHYDLGPTAAGTPLLLVDRRGDGVEAEVLDPGGIFEGHVRFGPRGPARGRGRSQSPDGSMVIEGTLITGRGESADLAAVGGAGRLSGYTWRDDSGGACALDGDGSRETSLVVFTFTPGRLGAIRTARFPLPGDVAYRGQLGPSILACAGADGAALLGVTGAGDGRVDRVDLVTGRELTTRAFGGPVLWFVASADGRLLAANHPAPSEARLGERSPVVDLKTGRVLASLDSSLAVRAFTSDDRAVLVSPQSAHGAAPMPGASLWDLGESGPTWWTGPPGVPLRGWQVIPGTGRVAVAVSVQVEATQELLVLARRAAPPTTLGRGVGVWGYAP